MLIKLRFSTAMLLFVLAMHPAAWADNPAQPANLRALVYSSTAIEIFWDRVIGSALNYEISIDGEVVTTSQGTSYFTNRLDSGNSYTFDVVAIDASNNRSLKASVVAVTSGGSGTPPNGPAAPDNVNLVVYSQTAAELFWDRAPAADRVTSTQIKRDDELIGMAEGNSFFDNTREPGAHYIYDLTAIDNRGRRSMSTQLLEQPLISTINRDNHVELLAVALAVYSGDSYNSLLIDLQDRLLSTFLGEVFTDEVLLPVTYTCNNGGTAYFAVSPLDVLFSDCQIDQAVYDGPFYVQSGNSNQVSSTGLTISAPAGTTLQFDGALLIAARYFYSTIDVNAHLTSPTAVLSVTTANTEFGFTHLSRCCSGSPNFLAGFKGSFDFFTHRLDERQIFVSTLVDFNYSEPFATHTDNWNYRTGVLRLAAADDSEVVLNANTGNDATVDIQINNKDGFEQFTQPWSLWHSVLRRSP